MKLGKIYDYRNKEEAKNLIGKKVLATDYICNLENSAGDIIGTFEGLSSEKEYPFNVAVTKLGLCVFQFIREIEEDKPKLMTNKQLAKWLAGNHGQLVTAHTLDVRTNYIYKYGSDDKFVFSDFLIRSWDSDEWVKPTLYIYLRDCKEKMDEVNVTH